MGSGLIKENDVIDFVRLEGGVSSDIYLIRTPVDQFVVKQALPVLQVDDHWAADVRRNLAEQDFITYVSGFALKNVPQILAADRQVPYFVMEYIDRPFQNWKSQLLQGHFSITVTKQAVSFLAKIHRQAWEDTQVQTTFDHMEDFWSLRIEPYLVTTGRRHPQWQHLFDCEADRLTRQRYTLVHGDFSPKNILSDGSDVILLDHEVACYADPAFDIAFFFNHLVLKNVWHAGDDILHDLIKSSWSHYFLELMPIKFGDLEKRTCRLLLMLMLARVDGKSPVEYLDDEKKNFIRTFVTTHFENIEKITFFNLIDNLQAALK